MVVTVARRIRIAQAVAVMVAPQEPQARQVHNPQLAQEVAAAVVETETAQQAQQAAQAAQVVVAGAAAAQA